MQLYLLSAPDLICSELVQASLHKTVLHSTDNAFRTERYQEKNIKGNLRSKKTPLPNRKC